MLQTLLVKGVVQTLGLQYVNTEILLSAAHKVSPPSPSDRPQQPVNQMMHPKSPPQRGLLLAFLVLRDKNLVNPNAFKLH